jgi:hypothetical protein
MNLAIAAVGEAVDEAIAEEEVAQRFSPSGAPAVQSRRAKASIATLRFAHVLRSRA